VTLDVVGQGPEGLRLKQRDPIEHARLDLVHLDRLLELHPVILHRATSKLLERVQHPGRVVLFRFVPAHGDVVVEERDAVGEGGQVLLQPGRLVRQRGEGGRAGVGLRELVEPPEAVGLVGRRLQALAEAPHGLEVDLHRVEEPELLLDPIGESVDLSQVPVHRAHPLDEGLQAAPDVLTLQIPEHLLGIPDQRRVARQRVEEGLQVVVPARGGDRLHHLVQVQIAEEPRLLQPLHARPLLGEEKEDADEGRRRTPRAPPSPTPVSPRPTARSTTPTSRSARSSRPASMALPPNPR